MGFYGNITNTTRTQFSFDATYPSRRIMDEHAADDRVYVGRYVLVEYDSDGSGAYTGAPQVYKITKDGLKNDFVLSISEDFIVDGEQDKDGNKKNPTIIRCIDDDDRKAINEAKKNGEEYYTDNLVEEGTILCVPGKINSLGNPIYNLVSNSGTNKNPSNSTLYDEYWIAEGNTQFTVIKVVEDQEGNPKEEPTTFKAAKLRNLGDSSEDNFSKNFNMDKAYYNTSRGYDSTVWQKVLDKGYEKYVMVAELNTVVPSFDITADAPTLIPLRPHFDVDSTNVYYKLHWQPTWGLRIKANNYDIQMPQYDLEGNPVSATISASNDRVEYPTNEMTTWTKIEFDKSTNSKKTLYAQQNEDGSISWVKNNPLVGQLPELGAAIYYNKEGFDPKLVSKSWDRTYFHQHGIAEQRDPSVDPDVESGPNANEYGFVKDEILLAPSGLSGQMYQNHNGAATPAEDTQELSIMLPSIGDAISNVWDLVYGGRATNEAIQKTQKRNMDVEWYDARAVQDRTGLRLVKDGFTYRMDGGQAQGIPRNYYNTANVNTVAGCINSVHDLMGMIIQPYDNMDVMNKNIANNDDDTIYFNRTDNKYYRRDMKYTYTKLPDSSYDYIPIDLSEGEFKADLYYVKNGDKYEVASGKYNKDLKYYVRQLGEKVKEGYKEVKVQPFDGRKYFYINNLINGGKDFISEPEYHRDKQYYTMDSDKIDKTRIDLGEDFQGYTYYQYYDKADNILKSPYYAIDWSPDGESYNPNNTYYEIEEVFSLSDVVSEPKYTDLYLPGIFYYKAWTNDVYSQLTWDKSRPDTKVYIKNDDDTYTLITNPIEGETYFERVHYAGEPYSLKDGEQPDKKEFDYRIDNSIMGTGNVNAEFGKTYPLIDHYMVKKGSKVTETYTEITTYEPVHFNEDLVTDGGYKWDPDKYGPVWVFDDNIKDYVPNILPYDKAKNEAGKYFIQQIKYVYVYAGGEIDESNPLHLLPYAQSEVEYIDPKGSNKEPIKYHITYQDLENGNPWCVKTKVHSVSYGTYFIYIPVTATSIRRQLVDFYTNPTKSEDERLQYYQLKKKKISKFYSPYLYYYRVGAQLDADRKGSYILETNKNLKVDNVDDYSLAHLTITSDDYHLINEHDKDENRIYFYYPNYFYRKDGNEYVLAQEKEMNPNETYYIIENFYIDSDDMNIMPHGQRWNPKIKHIPPSVSLATRDVGFTYYELVDFARKLNTIHGMILKMNQVIDSEDTDTRDLRTIQGALNTFNDWISHLGKLDSQDVVIVDNYGRLTSAPANVTQNGEGLNHKPGTKSDVTGIESDVFPMAENLTTDGGFKNQWLTVNVDGKPTNPVFNLRHNYQPVKDTTSDSDMNNPKTDTMKLYTPIVDPKGHVVGHNDHTVTLPYGFKTITTNGRGSNTTENASTNPIVKNVVADNTQDTLGINSGNKWVRIDTDESTDTITISHDIHNQTLTDKNKTDLNNPQKDSIIIQDTTFDAAGHMTANQKHEYTLPYGFKFITTNGRNSNNNTEDVATQEQIEADNTQDTLGINSGNEWICITTDPTMDVLTISHDVKKTTSVKADDVSLSSETAAQSFSITLYDFDEKNHFSKKTTTKYTLPNNYGKIAADTGATTEATSSHDTFTLSGDSWIKTTVSKDKVSFAHQAPQATKITVGQTSNSSPALGGTFSVPKVSYDANGHVSDSETYIITLPSLKLSGAKGNTDNVMTNLTYTQNGDTFTATFGKIGDLALTGYQALNNDPTEDISATDSLNTGLSKLRRYIIKEANDRGTAITSALGKLNFEGKAATGYYISSIKQDKGLVSITTTAFPTATTSSKGMVSVVNNYSEDPEDLFSSVPSSMAFRDALKKFENYYKKTDTFDYTKTIQDSTTKEVSSEVEKLTIEQIIERISNLEKTIVFQHGNILESSDVIEGGTTTDPTPVG